MKKKVMSGNLLEYFRYRAAPLTTRGTLRTHELRHRAAENALHVCDRSRAADHSRVSASILKLSTCVPSLFTPTFAHLCP